MFSLHPRLEADTFAVVDWPLCRVRLMNDARYPWLILVPVVADVTELHHLDDGQGDALMREVRQASRLLAAQVDAHKMNLGALGNLVPQLHLHVIARFRNDPAWPGPVWGTGPARPYADVQREQHLAELRSLLGGFRGS